VAQNCIRWRALQNTVINLQLRQQYENLTSKAINSSSKMILLRALRWREYSKISTNSKETSSASRRRASE